VREHEVGRGHKAGHQERCRSGEEAQEHQNAPEEKLHHAGDALKGPDLQSLKHFGMWKIEKLHRAMLDEQER